MLNVSGAFGGRLNLAKNASAEDSRRLAAGAAVPDSGTEGLAITDGCPMAHVQAASLLR